MNERQPSTGLRAEAMRGVAPLVCVAALFSAAVAALMLTGPVFMLHLYDSVLPARSAPTLVALVGIAAALYLGMAILDAARSRLLARAGARMAARADALLAPGMARHVSRIEAVDAVVRLSRHRAASALFDLPWLPGFLLVLALLHPLLAVYGAAAGLLVAVLAVAGHIRVAGRLSRAQVRDAEAWRLAREAAQARDAAAALAMGPQLGALWQRARQDASGAGLRAADTAGDLAAASLTLRLALQTGALAIGAGLVLADALDAGAMVGGAILFGRALAPIDHLAAGWPAIAAARSGWRALAEADPARQVAFSTPTVPLPGRGQVDLSVRDLTVLAPVSRKAVLRMVSFDVAPGEALGVIGPSGAGKSSLVMGLSGAWPVAGGEIRLGGLPLTGLDEAARRRTMGVLPQSVALFRGTVAENIARFDPSVSETDVRQAAELAGLHDLILGLPSGYQTPIAPEAAPFSGGEAQRLGLARALCGLPPLLVLDEPNASLDHSGTEAMLDAIAFAKASGCSVVMMVHRPAALRECDRVMALSDGIVRAIGPREQVLAEVLQPGAGAAA